jgi:hypothetical protein
VDDLKLLHFWIVNTASSMSAGHGAAHLWQNIIVDMSFHHHFLLHGILAVAAVHKATIFPAERESLITQSASHISIAITSFKDLLEAPLPATCVPVFVMAGLISIHSLGLAQVRPPTDAVADIFTWARLVKGTQSTIRDNWELLQTSEIAPLLALGRPQMMDHEFEEINRLKSLVQDEAGLSASVREIYYDTVQQLQIVYGNMEHAPRGDGRASSLVSSWVALVPEQYHELLASREPVALVIIAYFAVLFKTPTHIWWFRSWSTWILGSVRAQLPRVYESWLEWPAAQIERG